MPWDCDRYFAFDRTRDADIWPVTPARHAPVFAAALAAVAAVLAIALA